MKSRYDPNPRGLQKSRIQTVGFADLKGGFHSEAGALDFTVGPLGPLDFIELKKGSQLGAETSSYRKGILSDAVCRPIEEAPKEAGVEL